MIKDKILNSLTQRLEFLLEQVPKMERIIALLLDHLEKDEQLKYKKFDDLFAIYQKLSVFHNNSLDLFRKILANSLDQNG